MTDGLVAGRFRLTALRGSGGTAAVFAAVDEATGRSVALKLLHPHLAADRAVWDAFFEEVRAAQSIVHPLVAEILDAGTVETDPPVVWIAMELVDGVTLEEHVRARGPLAAAAARMVADGLLDALAAAHRRGVVHRDLTPANVMFDPTTLDPFDADGFRRSIRLLDFGLADVPGRTTRGSDALLAGAPDASAGVVASVPYASPEHLSGEPVTEASDVYQAGATLFFAVAGQPPFRGPVDAVVRAHLTAPPPVPSAARRGVDRTMDRLVTTAMLKRPVDRYADAAEMRAALAAAPAPDGPRSVDPIPADEVVTRAQGSASVMPAGAASVDAEEESPATRVYRTSVPEAGGWRVSPPMTAASHRARWPAWVAGAAGVAALVGIVALSAVAGSAPSPTPTLAQTTPAPIASATPEQPSPAAAAEALIDVPAVIGLPLDAARTQLIDQGFAVGAGVAVDTATPSGTVLSADPAAGARRPRGTTVTLQYASGRNAVPPVIGLTAADAAGVLRAAGFLATVRDAGSGVAGIVSASEPVAGAVAGLGTEVTLWVPASAPPAPSPSPVLPSPAATPLPSPSATPMAP